MTPVAFCIAYHPYAVTHVFLTMVGTKMRRRGGAADSAMLSAELHAAMRELRDRDAEAFEALLAFARRIVDLAVR